MKLFRQREIREAIAHAEAGGQALHRHRILSAGAPACFVRDINQGRMIGHLFDQDIGRLRRTAKRLGVRAVRVEDRDTPRQHVDLCGRPLWLAVAACMAGLLVPPKYNRHPKRGASS